MQGVLDATLSDEYVQLFTAGRWFSSSTPVSPNTKTDLHYIA